MIAITIMAVLLWLIDILAVLYSAEHLYSHTETEIQLFNRRLTTCTHPSSLVEKHLLKWLLAWRNVAKQILNWKLYEQWPILKLFSRSKLLELIMKTTRWRIHLVLKVFYALSLHCGREYTRWNSKEFCSNRELSKI